MTESSVPKPRDLEEALDVIATLHEQLQRSQRENDLLRHRLDSLCRRMFGKKSEKVDPSQLRLAFEMLEGADTSSGVLELDSGENIPKIQVRGHGRKRSKGRRPLPADLPRERQVVDIDESEKTCSCGCVKEKIGEIVTEKLEYVPSSFFVRETVRPKYACGRCHAGVSVASAPAQAVEKVIAGEGLLAHVVVSKYAEQLAQGWSGEAHRRTTTGPSSLWNDRGFRLQFLPILGWLLRDVVPGIHIILACRRAGPFARRSGSDNSWQSGVFLGQGVCGYGNGEEYLSVSGGTEKQ